MPGDAPRQDIRLSQSAPIGYGPEPDLRPYYCISEFARVSIAQEGIAAADECDGTKQRLLVSPYNLAPNPIGGDRRDPKRHFAGGAHHVLVKRLRIVWCRVDLHSRFFKIVALQSQLLALPPEGAIIYKI